MAEIEELIITQHAKERYAERIMGKQEVRDINIYVLEEEEKIKSDISKMVEYGEEIYFGNLKEKNSTYFILNGTWVIILDKSKRKVITLYKIDLGLGEEFNKTFIKKSKEKIDEMKHCLLAAEEEMRKEEDYLEEQIQDVVSMINKKKTEIKNLEELEKNYRDTKKSLMIKKVQYEDNLKDSVASLICKKEF